jgi:uncharacterized protein YacL
LVRASGACIKLCSGPPMEVAMFVEGVRLLVAVLGTATGFWVARRTGSEVQGLGGMLGCLFGYVLGGIFGRTLDHAIDGVEKRVEKRSPARVIAGMLGALVGSTLALLLVVPFAIFLDVKLAVAIVGLAAWVFAWAGYRIVAHQSEAVLEMLGLSTRPLVRAQAYDVRDGMVVDTSVVMDGQLLALSRAGVFGGDLMVPRFVLDELQGFADSPDDVKRRRARRGLETLEVLRNEGRLRVFVLDDEVPEVAEVDAKLIVLARRLQLRLLTNDGPLARNAELQGVPTCNLRKLVQELTPSIGPGDYVRVALTREGKEAGQGVGHLEDGSMVVVNGGDQLVGGPEVMLQVTSVVPTSAGRLLFARVEDD